jgi:cephalosporin hydroxylase
MYTPEPAPANGASTPSLHSLLQRNAALGGRKVRKYANYIDLYDQLFRKFVGRRPRILEIGVQHGGSLQIWNEFFRGEVEIFGIDILPECQQLEENNINIFIGDQSDIKFLTAVSNKIGHIDLVIDDGSHVSKHQIATFEILFYNNLNVGGFYIVEDCHSSYMPEYGGGLGRRGTFIEYAKDLCDSINAWHAGDKRLHVTEATRWIRRITFESSLVVFEKNKMSAPAVVSTGVEEIDTVNIFGDSAYAPLLRTLRGFAPLRYAIRNNQFLWKLMRKVVAHNRQT